MPNTEYGVKIKPFKRFAKADRWVGQGRLPEHRYIAFPFEYDTSVAGNVTKFEIGLVVAKHPAKLADGTTVNPKAGEVAPYVKGDALLGRPFGILLEPQDLETDLNTSIYLKGAWDTAVSPIKGLDVLDETELRKLNATNIHGVLFWDTTLPTPL